MDTKVEESAVCNVNSLFKQAHAFANAHSYYKIKQPWTMYTALKSDGNGSMELILFVISEKDGKRKLHWPERNAVQSFLQPETGSDESSSLTMLASSFKYPVVLTKLLGGHEFEFSDEQPKVRAIFANYRYYLRQNGLTDQDDLNLPPFDEKTMSSVPKQFKLSAPLHHPYGHEKWRMIGEMVHAACNVASDCGITVDWSWDSHDTSMKEKDLLYIEHVTKLTGGCK